MSLFERPRRCVACNCVKAETRFHWQYTELAGRRVHVRDKTCKRCRTIQQRERRQAQRLEDRRQIERRRQFVVVNEVARRFACMAVRR